MIWSNLLTADKVESGLTHWYIEMILAEMGIEASLRDALPEVFVRLFVPGGLSPTVS